MQSVSTHLLTIVYAAVKSVNGMYVFTLEQLVVLCISSLNVISNHSPFSHLRELYTCASRL